MTHKVACKPGIYPQVRVQLCEILFTPDLGQLGEENEEMTNEAYPQKFCSTVWNVVQAGWHCPQANFLTTQCKLLQFVDFHEGGFVFIPSLSYILAGYHARTSVEAARRGKLE